MLKKKSGKVINITSIVGHTGNLGQANYTASKAGIVAMSKSLAIEYAKKNININCISPGFIKTSMTDKIDEKFKEIIISKIPSARASAFISSVGPCPLAKAWETMLRKSPHSVTSNVPFLLASIISQSASSLEGLKLGLKPSKPA